MHNPQKFAGFAYSLPGHSLLNGRSFVQIRTVISLLQVRTQMDVILDYGLTLCYKHTADKTQYFS